MPGNLLYTMNIGINTHNVQEFDMRSVNQVHRYCQKPDIFCYIVIDDIGHAVAERIR